MADIELVIKIPEKEFGIDINNKFQDFFSRLKAEIKEQLITNTSLICGAYELETIDMLLGAFKNSTPLPKRYGEWIPVSEGLPKKYKMYLVTLNNHDTDFCEFHPNNHTFGMNENVCDEVTAWMPLPEPYGAESEGKALDQESSSWCTDCKEYDHDEHCCHRFSKVIRDTVEEMKQEPVIEKIRSEIIKLTDSKNAGILDCLDIIDKYTEREDK